MTGKTPDPEKSHSKVTIGDVDGGIHNSTIVGGNVVQQIINFFIGCGRDEQRAQRYRQIMLERVRQFWVEGVLEKSLHKEILIQLGKQEQPDAVQHPWDMQVQETAEREPRPIPKDKPVIEIFEEMGRSILILGAPGSGKTITLLELARDAITFAEEEPSLPIPVVFHLSSWEPKLKLADWLVAELNLKYNIPKRVGTQWLKHEDLLVLLDGLDEVKQRNREACVKAINAFRQEYGLTKIAVCSRIEEYQKLAMQLNLQGAIQIHPLTLEQIDLYLANFGDELSVLRATLKNDVTLKKLAESPLMLGIMVIAYQGVSVELVQTSEMFKERQKRLFNMYVERMVKRRGVNNHYTVYQNLYWLSCLSRMLSKYARMEFSAKTIKQNCSEIIETVKLTTSKKYLITVERTLFEVVVALLWVSLFLPIYWIAIVLLLYDSYFMGVSLIIGVTFELFYWLFSHFMGYDEGSDEEPGCLYPALFYLITMGASMLTVIITVLLSIVTDNDFIADISSGIYWVMIVMSLGTLFRFIGIAIYDGLVVNYYWRPIILYFILALNGYVPYNLNRLLTYATDHIFLRKVGGGYIFIHRLLLEYFASLEHKK